MNPKNCKITGIHEPIPIANYFQCRWCHLSCDQHGILIPKAAKVFDKTKVYSDLVKYYIDKKGYSKEYANTIAQRVIEDQLKK